MILSASRRTDIPCHYSEWFMNRIQAGYVLVRNPMNPAQISKIPLSPGDVDCIVFWTKDAANMLDKLEVLDGMGYRYYFQFTITPYDPSVEKGLRGKTGIEDTFIRLSRAIGKSRVLWRYDPIVFNDTLSIPYHKEQFARMCEKLCGYTESVTISFVDMYAKLKAPLLREAGEDEIAELAAFIGEQARACGLAAKACCEKIDLSPYGIAKASCIDQGVIERICGAPLKVKADKNQREGCGCCESIDIGAYGTCKTGCIYCYASHSAMSAKNSGNRHDPAGELLMGELREGEKPVCRKVGSNQITQQSLFTNRHNLHDFY